MIKSSYGLRSQFFFGFDQAVLTDHLRQIDFHFLSDDVNVAQNFGVANATTEAITKAVLATYDASHLLFGPRRQPTSKPPELDSV